MIDNGMLLALMVLLAAAVFAGLAVGYGVWGRDAKRLREALGLCEMAITEWDNEGLALQAKSAIARLTPNNK